MSLGESALDMQFHIPQLLGGHTQEFCHSQLVRRRKGQMMGHMVGIESAMIQPGVVRTEEELSGLQPNIKYVSRLDLNLSSYQQTIRLCQCHEVSFEASR